MKKRIRASVDFTKGNIVSGLVKFSIPLMIGNVLQQLYNVVDTLIVGKYIGDKALAAVGSAYSIIIFLTSIIIGLCMGSSVFLSNQYGKNDKENFACGNFMSFSMIGLVTVVLNIIVYIGNDIIFNLLHIPTDIYPMMCSYVMIIYSGILGTFIYNYFANSLRAVGNSLVPLIFLGISTIMNIFLDILFVVVLKFGIKGAAVATVISQYASGIGLWIYAWKKCKILRFKKKYMHFRKDILGRIFNLSILTSLQQSIMNFGILMVQGVVNSFGTSVMAAFSAAVKVDTLAYSPVQDFGYAFSTFVAQNHGADKKERINIGIKKAILAVSIFGIIISLIVCLFAGTFIGIFTDNTQIIKIGVSYLRIEGVFYILIGYLFILYGYFRAIERPIISIILTIVSLGTRVALSYILSGISVIGYTGIWMSIPIGWALADIVGYIILKFNGKA